MPSSNPFLGKWTYRSFNNSPALVGSDPSKLEALLFGEAQWTVEPAGPGIFLGVLSFGPGAAMDLKGTITLASGSHPASIHVIGSGRAGTSTAAYFYDYQGYLVPKWPNGVQQRDAIVGSTIRVKPHDGGAAGYTASFIAVKQD